ncbi:hypothetical protein [Zhihengliuella sp.]|uniref:hypothetical protein n=1 Tax=Zhihengliuella sp. TaxID=1954483 RepID=UPI002811B688|nr:hypothetical protein [Zhihengliuella sp.]
MVQKVARVVSHVLSPTVLGTLVLLSIPLRYAAVAWAPTLVAAAFTIVIPWAVLVWMRMTARVTDLHVTRREQRWPILLIALVSILAGLGLLRLMGASPIVFAEMGLFLAGLLITGAANLFWKLSIHAAVASFAALHCLAPLPLGPQLAVVLIALVGWSRIRITHHTASQVLAGTVVGAAVSLGGLLPPLG